ncbi:hypothetical protein TREMEDRAFT_67737 [Tremella mesenterica DSM 1558]|uniref:uncharacterized protein n=1 Tax=Tremella mesenterica (strain ATCC 24925 / CBS 8224 / DSM 1558 / NBRC 9311 / NRRL Y-6157 / RJB 2259-6 / UBC 559-6) TaxID=578456 RepID=UPI0003F49C04|nr:uncharacterized protein TREMEDRAFT_67737 [Tremella mesenterica DSM 1558]EIW71389.1 hypothetical protein TREMEDRAFT_67737 [Tremella mesenterica DSM 1558]
MYRRVVKKHLPTPSSDSESDAGSDSSSEVEEDEDGDELTPALDAAILRTLHKIRNKQGVYEGEDVLANELKEAEQRARSLNLPSNTEKRTSEKPYLLADHHRESLLRGEREEAPEGLTHVQSQAKLRAETVDAFKALAKDDDEDEDGEGFVLQPRPVVEHERDQDEYRKFLLEMGGGEEEVRKLLGMGDQPLALALQEDENGEERQETKVSDLKSSRNKRKNVKVKQDEDFLMNYILNRGWVEKPDNHIPTFDEITGEKKPVDQSNPDSAGPSHPWGALEEEDEFDERAEAFETEYNFRFEEPGASNIISHPRNIPSLVRRPDDTRKRKRAEKKAREAEKKAAEEEEIRRLKGSRRREIESEMERLKRDLGEGMDWAEVERLMEGDFDESQWENVIGRMLEQQGEGEDDSKPVWDDMDDEEYDDPMESTEENQDVDADAKYIDPTFEKKRSKKDRNAEDDDGDVPIEARAEKVKKALKAYRELDHEDKIGEMPTRFKYTKTAPATYGLTQAEILLATDAELNSIMSLKKLATYRKGGYGLEGQNLGRRVRELKEILAKRAAGEEEPPSTASKPRGHNQDRQREQDSGWSQRLQRPTEGGVEDKGKRPGKRMGRNERMKKAAAALAEGSTVGETQQHGVQVEEKSNEGEGEQRETKKRRKNKKKGKLTGQR